MRRIPVIRRQSGFAMIVIVSLIVLMSAYLIASGLGRTTAEIQTDRSRLTSKALQDAKSALLGYVARDAADTSNAVPGRFPCFEDASLIQDPPLATEGNQKAGGTCNTNANIQFGRLPWKTIGLGDIRDGWGEKLWYVLSPGFRASPVNSTTPGQLMLDGVPVVALIIAPGPAINPQARPALPGSMTYNYFSTSSVYSNYLEGENASSPVDLNFTSTGPSNTFNDQVIAITQREVFDIVEPIVAARIAAIGTADLFPEGLTSYYSKWNAYPFAVPFGDPVSSSYRGANATYQGLTPATTTAGDTTFVTWAASPAPVVTYDTNNGTVNSQNCTGTGSQTLACSFNYSRTGGRTPTITIAATVSNVGMAFREPLVTTDITITNCSGGGACVLSNQTLSPQNLSSTGNLAVTFSAKLPNLGPGNKNATINIPVPGDNAMLSHWFFTNQWQRATYYAVASEVAPAHTPLPPCGTCITVNGTSGKQVVMILMGRALGTQVRPGNVLQYLDGTNGVNALSGTLSYVQLPHGGDSNDATAVVQ